MEHARNAPARTAISPHMAKPCTLLRHVARKQRLAHTTLLARHPPSVLVASPACTRSFWSQSLQSKLVRFALPSWMSKMFFDRPSSEVCVQLHYHAQPGVVWSLQCTTAHASLLLSQDISPKAAAENNNSTSPPKQPDVHHINRVYENQRFLGVAWYALCICCQSHKLMHRTPTMHLYP